MKFHITQHAKKRLRQRGIEKPNKTMGLTLLGKKGMRRIYRTMGIKIKRVPDTVYLLHGNTVYVCQPIKPKEFLLLTAYKLVSKIVFS